MHCENKTKFNQLPEAAQQFINTYFPDQKVSFAKEERDFMEVSYEVMFTNSIKIEFAGNGEWKEVKCKYSTLPEGAYSGLCKHQFPRSVHLRH